jgi:hypothetical protein
MHSAACSRIVVAEKRGYTHAYSLEQLRAFRDVPAADKLRWLENMRRFLEKSLTADKIEIMRRFRRGDL